MEPTNKMNKFTVAVINNKKIIRHLLLGKTGCFSKIILYFLKCKYNDCKVKVTYGKAVSFGSGIGIQKLSKYLPRMKLDDYSFELHQEHVHK